VADFSITSRPPVSRHRDATWAHSVSQPRIFVVQDATCVNFTGHAATQGLGPVELLNDRGLMVHSALAITPDGVPLGIVPQEMWARDLGTSN